MNGAPMGRDTGIPVTFCGNPQYDRYGTPSLSRAIALPSPTLSTESATCTTKRGPLPGSTVALGIVLQAAENAPSTPARMRSRVGTSAGILASHVKRGELASRCGADGFEESEGR